MALVLEGVVCPTRLRAAESFRQTTWKNPDIAVYYQHNLFLYVDGSVHRSLVASIGVPDRNSELTLVRTSIMQGLTRPSLATKVLAENWLGH